MNWLPLTIIAAISLGVTEYLTKRAYDHFDTWSVSWVRNTVVLGAFFTLLFVQGVPEVDSNFWGLLKFSVPLELIVGITFFVAIKLTPLSLVLPFNTFATLFIAIGAYFINDEAFKLAYLPAFICILLGAYFIQEKRKIDWRQLNNHKSEIGIGLMIFSTMIFGLTVPIGKVMADASSIFFYLAVNWVLFILFFTPIAFYNTKNTVADFKKHYKHLLAIGICNSIFLSCLWSAFATGPAGSVSAVNNLNILVAVLLGGTLLKEKGLKRRLLATLLMITGATIAILG